MNKLIPFFILAVFSVSCGTASRRSSVSSRDEVLNIGYGKQMKENNTYAISKLDVKENELAPYNNIFDYLKGRVAGVQVIGNKIIIRGVGTINGSTDPLILVDGIKTDDISYLNPIDVADVTVLKDASSSIYGVQGANGVILITTKK